MKQFINNLAFIMLIILPANILVAMHQYPLNNQGENTPEKDEEEKEFLSSSETTHEVPTYASLLHANESLIQASYNNDPELVRRALDYKANPNIVLNNNIHNQVLNHLSSLKKSEWFAWNTLTSIIPIPHIWIPVTAASFAYSACNIAGSYDHGPFSQTAKHKRFLETHTPLMALASRSKYQRLYTTPLDDAITDRDEKKSIEITKLLLNSKAQLTIPDQHGYKALSYAIDNNNKPLIRLLLLAGAPPPKAPIENKNNNNLQETIQAAIELRHALVGHAKILLNKNSHLTRVLPTKAVARLVIAYTFPPENKNIDYEHPDIIWLLDYLKHNDPDFSMTR